MTKADIVEIIANGTGLTKVETEAVVNGFIQTVIQSLRDGKNIEIRGFGSFHIKKEKDELHEILEQVSKFKLKIILCQFLKYQKI